jgi:iron complex transport system substrate-binding protein
MAALLASIGAAALFQAGDLATVPQAVDTEESVQQRARRPELPASLIDATGRSIPLRPYRRIASGSTLVDRLLLALAEPDRVVALTAHGARTSPWKHLYGRRARLESLDDLEAVLQLKTDLLIVNNGEDPGRVARLREVGVVVFDLGAMRGVQSLREQIPQVAALLGVPEAGEAYGETWMWRLRHVSAPLGDRPRRRAMYASIYGDRIFGGTAGSSYHDVLTYAGLVDIAAERFRNWPAYTSSDLLALAPELIVTKPGMRPLLCSQPGLDRLRACLDPRGVVEIPSNLLDDPGPTMLEAAEQLFHQVYEREGETWDKTAP